MYNVLPKFDDGDVLLRFTNEKDEEVCTYEALLRMHSPVLGMIALICETYQYNYTYYSQAST